MSDSLPLPVPNFEAQFAGLVIERIRLDASPAEFIAAYDAAFHARMALRLVWVATFRPGQPASLAPF